eukprot:3017098-Prymnesium_polylepis.1
MRIARGTTGVSRSHTRPPMAVGRGDVCTQPGAHADARALPRPPPPPSRRAQSEKLTVQSTDARRWGKNGATGKQFKAGRQYVQ